MVNENENNKNSLLTKNDFNYNKTKPKKIGLFYKLFGCCLDRES